MSKLYRREGLSGREIAAGILIVAAAICALLYFGENTRKLDEQSSFADADAGTSESAEPPPAPEQPKTPAAPTPKPILPEGQGVLRNGETFSAALESHGFSPAQIHSVVASLSTLYDFRYARPGAKFSYKRDLVQQKIQSLRFEPTPLEIYEVAQNENGRLEAQRVPVLTHTVEAAFGAQITSSLWGAVQSTGESTSIVQMITDVFAWDVDFYQDTHPGDQFKLIVEKVFKEDEFIEYGRVLAAEYQGKTGTFRSFWFAPNGETGEYYLEDGQSARKNLLATPLKFTRVSSGFGKRRHPILGFTKQHNGIDFAAPTGTPIWAMASGKVIFAGMKGANGNLIIIDHGNGLQTLYAHLHRINKNIVKGAQVEQKQTIGTVGSTGRSTGPHLHLGIKQNGKYVDPGNLKKLRANSLPAKHKAAFNKHVEAMKARLAAIDTTPKAKAQKAPETPEVAEETELSEALVSASEENQSVDESAAQPAETPSELSEDDFEDPIPSEGVAL